MEKNVILIPARSGSTRLINKNIKNLNGKPLISYSIKAAIDSCSGPVFVSTDSKKYKTHAENYGAKVPFIRPRYLSTASAPSCWVIIHFLKWFEKEFRYFPEFISFSPPTNPLLKSQTINNMLEKLIKNEGYNSIITYTIPITHPFKIIKVFKNGKIKNDIIKINGQTINDVERTQDFPIVFESSPACRITRSKFFVNILKSSKSIKDITFNNTFDHMKCIGYEISQNEASDIDTFDDFIKIENIIK